MMKLVYDPLPSVTLQRFDVEPAKKMFFPKLLKSYLIWKAGTNRQSDPVDPEMSIALKAAYE